MDLSEETFNEIQDYLSGKGNETERKSFELRMQQDQELAGEVALQRRIRSGLKVNQYRDLFGEIHEKLREEGTLPELLSTDAEKTTAPLLVHTRRMWPYLAAAASVVMAIGIAWYFYWSPRQRPAIATHSDKTVPVAKDSIVKEQPATTPDIAESKTPERPSVALPDADASFNAYFSPLEDIKSPFSKESFGISPAAIAQWRSDTASVRNGLRLLQEGNATAALEQFKTAEQSRYREVQEHAMWYGALAYLKQKEIGLCREKLRDIEADQKHLYHEKASQLLKKLE